MVYITMAISILPIKLIVILEIVLEEKKQKRKFTLKKKTNNLALALYRTRQ